MGGSLVAIHQLRPQCTRASDVVQRSCTERLRALAGIAQEFGQTVQHRVNPNEWPLAAVTQQLKVHRWGCLGLPGWARHLL